MIDPESTVGDEVEAYAAMVYALQRVGEAAFIDPSIVPKIIKVLEDAGALDALESYQDRFPSGE